MDFNETVFKKITDFIQNIGIPIGYRQISEQSFLPGLMIENGTLWIDKKQLKYIGDSLHEAGHIALMTPEQRKNLSGELEGQNDAEATEMAVIAWTYAACLEIGIDPAVVFHPDGYKGGSESILENFGNGQYFGVPILEWYGMTERINNTQQKNTKSYPKMLVWIRT
jgi:hypothetical protein